jgi:hypothetical protein
MAVTAAVAPVVVADDEGDEQDDDDDDQDDAGQYSKPLPPMNSRRIDVGGTWSG